MEPGVQICCWIIFKGHVGRRIIVLVNSSVCVGVMGGRSRAGRLFDTHTTHLPHTMQSSKRIGANTKTRKMFMVGLKLIVACAALLTKSKQSSPDVA